MGELYYKGLGHSTSPHTVEWSGLLWLSRQVDKPLVLPQALSYQR
jgi:hypothetical protein